MVQEHRGEYASLWVANTFLPKLQHRPQTQVLRSFVDQHHHSGGVEPICKVLQIAPSG